MGLSRGTEDAPSLEVFEPRLDAALNKWKVPCPWQWNWNKIIFRVPSNPNHFLIQSHMQWLQVEVLDTLKRCTVPIKQKGQGN